MMRQAARLAVALGAERMARHRNRRRLRILMYHGLVETPLSPFCWWQLPLASFEKQMRWVRDRYTVLPLRSALDQLRAGTLPEHACAITFDDGYRSNGELALPVLRVLGLPATIFLVTDCVGTSDPLWPDRVWQMMASTPAERADLSTLGLGVRSLEDATARGRAIADALEVLKSRPVQEKDDLVEGLLESLGGASFRHPAFERLTWPEVERLANDGLASFGAHSLTHEILRHCCDDQVERQVAGSIAALTARLPEEARVDAFAYPNGRIEDFDDRARRAVADAGLPWALSTTEGLVDGRTDPRSLPRIGVGADLAFDVFRLRCAGL